MMRQWLPERDDFLSELLELEARPDDLKCSSCKKVDGHLRCKDCLYGGILCQQCCLSLHKYLPFHGVEKWNGSFFEDTSLYSEGYTLCLGHGGDPCPKTSLPEMDDSLNKECDDDFVDEEEDPLLGKWERFGDDVIIIVDCGAVHQRRIQWCNCTNAPERHIQLLKHKLYPGSVDRPGTAFTFQVLQYFWIDAVECKTSAMNFFSKLRRLTNYHMPQRVPVSSMYTIGLDHLTFNSRIVIEN